MSSLKSLSPTQRWHEHVCDTFESKPRTSVSNFLSLAGLKRARSEHVLIIIHSRRAQLRVPPPLSVEGKPITPAPEKSFIQKYWIYIVPVLVIFCSYLDHIASCVYPPSRSDRYYSFQ